MIVISVGGSLLAIQILGQEGRQHDVAGFGVLLGNGHRIVRLRSKDHLGDFVGGLVKWEWICGSTHCGTPAARSRASGLQSIAWNISEASG